MERNSSYRFCASVSHRQSQPALKHLISRGLLPSWYFFSFSQTCHTHKEGATVGHVIITMLYLFAADEHTTVNINRKMVPSKLFPRHSQLLWWSNSGEKAGSVRGGDWASSREPSRAGHLTYSEHLRHWIRAPVKSVSADHTGNLCSLYVWSCHLPLFPWPSLSINCFKVTFTVFISNT